MLGKLIGDDLVYKIEGTHESKYIPERYSFAHEHMVGVKVLNFMVFCLDFIKLYRIRVKQLETNACFF